jgi:pantoate--beta-alanine ligase
MIVARTVTDARAALAGLPRPLGLVPTMGALHDGHLSLVRTARAECRAVAASIFVNPTQFGQGEDYQAYPRDEARDLEMLSTEGVDAAFVPSAAEMYAPGAATRVHVGGALTAAYEAASRPGHFDGVATVVLKLIQIAGCDRLYLGEKDAQQLAVVRRMVADLDVPVEVVGVPTLREPDGLALSSRNAYLDQAQRSQAPRLYHALRVGAAAAGGAATAHSIAGAVAAALDPATGAADCGGTAAAGSTTALSLDYAAVVDPDTFEPVAAPQHGHLIVAAARLGGVRLIDSLRL